MSDWDLMMPGMGLSAIGLGGVFLSYLGIANTFLTGMQALSGLTMFVGLIILGCGILNGGVSTSNRAKATTLVIFGISGSFGAFAMTQTNLTTLPRFAGVLIMIIIPTVIIAFTAMKVPQYLKPITVIFLLAMGVGLTSYTVLGYIGPGAQFTLNQSPVQNATNATTPAAVPNAPMISVEILANASMKGNPNYNPDNSTAPQGDVVEWTNNDNVVHTVTSADDAGATFDSNLIHPGMKYDLDTSKLSAKEYNYMCTVHPFMRGQIIITAQAKPVTANVTISTGASTKSAGQKYFDPAEISVKSGTTVVWTNDDSASHTVTSGDPTAGPSGTFDSGLIQAGKTFQYKFNSAGTTTYYCTIHPWMTGKITVG